MSCADEQFVGETTLRGFVLDEIDGDWCTSLPVDPATDTEITTLLSELSDHVAPFDASDAQTTWSIDKTSDQSTALVCESAHAPAILPRITEYSKQNASPVATREELKSQLFVTSNIPPRSQIGSEALSCIASAQEINSGEISSADVLHPSRDKFRDAMCDANIQKRYGRKQLKSIVTHLEERYRSLSLLHANRTLTTTPDTGNSTTISKVQMAYEKATELAKRLGEEKMALKALLLQRSQWCLQLRRIVESIAPETPLTTPTSSLDSKTDPKPKMLEHFEAMLVFRFQPVHQEDVTRTMLENLRVIHNIQNRLRSPSSGIRIDHVHVMGWELQRCIHGSKLEFLFTKRFTNVSLSQIMNRTWEYDMRLRRFQVINTETKRLDVLQFINSNAYIAGRVASRGEQQSKFHSVCLRFRVESNAEVTDPNDPFGVKHPAKVYFIGTQSMSFTNASHWHSDQENVKWANLTVGLEFFDAMNPITGEKYLEVRWTGETDYKSEFDAYRSAADTISTVLRWELHVIGPVLNMITSSC